MILEEEVKALTSKELVSWLMNSCGGIDSSCTPEKDQKEIEACRTELLLRLDAIATVTRERDALRDAGEAAEKHEDERTKRLRFVADAAYFYRHYQRENNPTMARSHKIQLDAALVAFGEIDAKRKE